MPREKKNVITLNFLALYSEHIRSSKSFVGDRGKVESTSERDVDSSKIESYSCGRNKKGRNERPKRHRKEQKPELSSLDVRPH